MGLRSSGTVYNQQIRYAGGIKNMLKKERTTEDMDIRENTQREEIKSSFRVYPLE